MHKKIITALCSYGMSGRVFHAPFITTNNNFELKYVLERSKNESQIDFPNVEIVRTYEELLSIQEISLIVVNTPSQLHFEMTKAALLAGKHVVVEKPFTLYSFESQELIALAESKKLALAVYHNKRLEGEFLTLLSVLKSNKLGEIQSFQSQFDRYRPEIGPKKWKEENIPGSGILYDLGSHLIDQILIAFGKPKSILADIQKQRPNSQSVDYFRVDFHYSNFTASATAGMLVKHIGPKYVLEGRKGKFVKYGTDPQEELLKNGAKPITANWGQEPIENHGKIYYQDGEIETVSTLSGSYHDFYNALYKHIEFGEDFSIKPYQAMQVIQMIEAAYKSHELKQVVELP